MRTLTALMVVGAIVLGAILLVPMSLAANGTAPGDEATSANGDCMMDKLQVKDQAQDGSCDQCVADQDQLVQQDQTRAQDGSCDGSVCVDGTCDPACDQMRERLQMQDGGNCGQMECDQMQEQEQVRAQLQDRSCTMSQSRMGKA